MNRKIARKLIMILLLTILFSFTYNLVCSATYSTINPEYIMEGAHEDSGAASGINNIIGAILTVLQVVAAGMAVIMLIVLAMKYMSSAPGDKADIKKSATIYVLGAIILFSGSGIIGIIRKFAVKNVK